MSQIELLALRLSSSKNETVKFGIYLNKRDMLEIRKTAITSGNGLCGTTKTDKIMISAANNDRAVKKEKKVKM